MRLMVTAESARTGARRDLVVSYSPESTVAELAGTLAARLAEPDTSNVVSLAQVRENGRDARGTHELYLGRTPLDPGQTIPASPVRHGAIVGVGGPSSDPEVEPGGLVEVRVTSGPGAGRVHRLGIGTTTLGSGHTCALRLDDPELPADTALLEVSLSGTVTVSPAEGVVELDRPAPVRRDAVTEPIVLEASTVEQRRRKSRLGWFARVLPGRRTKVSELRLGERVDPLDPVPLLHIERRTVTGPTTWEPGQAFGVGGVLLELVQVTEPDASLSPSQAGPVLDYNRPPRLHPAPRNKEFSLPQEPRRPDKMPFPMLMLLAPIVMSGSMYYFTRSPYSLLFCVMSPLMMLANRTAGRKAQKQRHREQLDEFHRRRIQVEEAAVDSLLGERAARRRNHPDPGAVLLFATGPRARLWERRRWDPDFLHLRVGSSDLPSDVTIKDSTRAAHEGPLRWTAPDVPVTVPLTGAGVLGVAGPASTCRQLGSWLLAQAATLHSPSDVALHVLTDPEGAAQWDWVKWLPHSRNGDDHPRPVRLSFAEDDRAATISELLGELERRGELGENDRAGLSRIVVVLDGARELRMESGVVSLLKQGPYVQIYFVCLDRTSLQLPEECRVVVECVGDLLNLETTEQRHVDGIRPDLVSADWLDRLARALSPIRDVSSEDLSATLPVASRLLDVLGLEDPTGDDVVRRWSGGGRTTKAVIGEANDGPFAIDIRADGPHGLVAGTTGAGKSELLQTIIASLSVGNRPDELNFVLVDYKGGAAFKDCNHLPHTVGMVTDLDGHLTTRALESLGAELRRREHQLADADAKDIEDYLATKGADDPPMPRLLIVIDEFAALVAELPDFVNGLVDVARRGRSLGVHLILATQRPSGVVSAEIKSNTNLRIALRVTDANDSDDVIDSPVAAHIAKSFPGRAYARLGHATVTPFQSARVGGRPRQGTSSAIGVTDFEWRDLPRAGRGTGFVAEEDVSIPTDLATLVSAVRGATTSLGIPQMRQPWLPPLPERLGLDALLTPDVSDGEVPPIAFGRADIPHRQDQRDEVWDLAHGSHLMIAGQSRSGRSTALRAIAASIGRSCSPADVHVFGIDAGNNALLPLVALPHVGAVVTRTQLDRMNRLLGWLQKEVARRQQLLAEQGFADVTEQRAHAERDQRLPYLVVLLDRWEGFTTAFESVDGGVLIENVTGLLQEGAGAGLRFVMAADRSGVLGRVSTLVEDRVVLSMADPGDYASVGLGPRQVPAVMPAGRGFRAGERPVEVQFALLDESGVGTDQVRALQEIGRKADEAYTDLPRGRRPHRIDELPSSITLTAARELEPASASTSFVPVGVGGDILSWQGFDPALSGSGFLVTGPPRSGKSNTLQVILQELLRRRRPALVFAPRISPLRTGAGRGVPVLTGQEPIDEIKSALDRLGRDHVVVVDDFEVIGADTPLGQELGARFGRMRDTGNLMVVAAGIDDLGGMYRGLAPELKRGRAGVVLSPRAANDGEVLNARLPRSAGGAVPTGRGVLTSPLGWSWVQVPRAPDR